MNKRTLALAAGALGSSILAYICYSYSRNDSEWTQFQNTRTYYSVDDLINDMEADSASDALQNDMKRLVKLYANVQTKNEPLKVLVNDQQSDLMVPSDTVKEAAIYNIHAECAVFSADETPTDQTASSAGNTGNEEQPFILKSQEEHYGYVMHGHVALKDDNKKQNSNHEIAIVHPINLLYEPCMLEMTVVSDVTQEEDPLFTEEKLIQTHLLNGEELLESGDLFVHTLTEVHSNDMFVEESSQQGETIIQEEEPESQKIKTAYNILRRILPTNTRVFVYGEVSYNSKASRYELSKIYNFSNVFNQKDIIQELRAEHFLSDIICITLTSVAVICGGLAIYGIITKK
jgi:hypothetical protein